MSNNSNKSQNITGIALNIKRGRPNGHNAGCKRKQIDNQSTLPNIFAKSSDEVVQSKSSTSNEQPQFHTTGIKGNAIPVNTEEAQEEFEDDSGEETFEELDEGTFNEIDEFASSLPSASKVAKYHDALQQRLREKNKNKSHLPDEYKRGTFWTQTRSPSFALANSVETPELYHPITSIWLPDHLHDNLVCPSCGSDIESKGFDKKN
ncbi:hypothetical protein INT47_009287 [Mucor saturninus]|uniref:Uncharacterized protein n=1 Tax=Mucor saturninus TaxID=64648 RepID=A0A8H7QI22_9FUNG|nr:hypothetical protein INT47_009287 [Mucor saturninus]